MTEYELWEADYINKKLFKRVAVDMVIDSIEEARKIAKKLAEAWCEDEKPSRWVWNPFGKKEDEEEEFWAGESDYAILIKKAKEK